MKSILVFIDGTIRDTRQRHHYGIKTLAFNKCEAIIKDKALPNGVHNSVNYETLKRTWKKSAYWYRDTIKSNSFTI